MSKIKIFSLGGLNENSKNMYVVEIADNINAPSLIIPNSNINIGIPIAIVLSAFIIFILSIILNFQK